MATIQQRLYRGYRAAGAAIEGGALLAAVVAAVLAAGAGPAFWLTVAAAVALLGAYAVFAGVTDVQNRRIAGWRADAPPADWQATLRRWELSHGIRAALFLLALGLLAGAMMSR